MLSKSLIVFYLFSLAVWPCKDQAFQSDGSLLHTIQKFDDKGDETNSDQCSAFCLCNCCGHQFVPSKEKQNPFLLRSSLLCNVDSYLSYPAFIFSHWQPPKA